MRLLLDTHAFIWYTLNDEKLSNSAKILINNGNNQIFLSMASFWEMGIKHSIGKLRFKVPFDQFMEQQIYLNNFAILNIETTHIAIIASLPLHHRDPFDRLLIAQAMSEQIPIISIDLAFDAYPIQRLW